MLAMPCHCFQFYKTVASKTLQIFTQHGIEFVSTKKCSYVAITENMDLNVMTTATQQGKLMP